MYVGSIRKRSPPRTHDSARRETPSRSVTSRVWLAFSVSVGFTVCERHCTLQTLALPSGSGAAGTACYAVHRGGNVYSSVGMVAQVVEDTIPA